MVSKHNIIKSHRRVSEGVGAELSSPLQLDGLEKAHLTLLSADTALFKNPSHHISMRRSRCKSKNNSDKSRSIHALPFPRNPERCRSDLGLGAECEARRGRGNESTNTNEIVINENGNYPSRRDDAYEPDLA